MRTTTFDSGNILITNLLQILNSYYFFMNQGARPCRPIIIVFVKQMFVADRALYIIVVPSDPAALHFFRQLRNQRKRLPGSSGRISSVFSDPASRAPCISHHGSFAQLLTYRRRLLIAFCPHRFSYN